MTAAGGVRGARARGKPGPRRGPASPKAAPPRPPFRIAGRAVPAGTVQKIEIPVARLATQTYLSLPVAVVHGRRDGPRLWVNAAVHGDEINGVEIIRQVLAKVRPGRLRGTLIAVPIVNVFGFIHQSRYLPDRRDLNRCFPGSRRGSLAARLAHLFLTEVVGRSTHGIDLHTAAPPRTNYPHVRANLDDPETARLAAAFGAPVRVHATTRDGSLREAAAGRGLPVLVFEGGEPHRFNFRSIRIGVRGILRVMTALGMARFAAPEAQAGIEARSTVWVRARRSGLFRAEVRLGEAVAAGRILGTIGDAFGDMRVPVRAPAGGLVISLVRNPLVSQGDGILHLAGAGAPPRRRIRV